MNNDWLVNDQRELRSKCFPVRGKAKPLPCPDEEQLSPSERAIPRISKKKAGRVVRLSV
jgi:hypothetical protein